MTRLILLVLALFTATANAEGLADMTSAERDAFRAEVRAYLLDNPDVILEAIQVLEERNALTEAENDRQMVLNNMAALTDDGYSFVTGNPDGAITIVEFMDYRCGYCKRAHPEVQALVESNDDIRLIVKEFPILGEESLLASRAATSVLVHQPNSYLSFSDLLMEHNGPINDVTLTSIATEADVDIDLMFANMETAEVTQILTSNHELAQKMQISGTPTFVFGLDMIRGYIPLAMMQQMVEELRAEL